MASNTITRAPRVPPGTASFAASVATFERSTNARLRRLIKAIEPWYDWGTFGISRVDGRGEGDGRFFEIDLFGLHLLIVVGRTPRPSEGC